MDEKIELLKQVLQIYSPSGEEQKLAQFLNSKMKELGFKSWIDEAGNVIGEVGSDRPILLFLPHIDTVPGFFYQEKDDVIIARGAVDTKSSLVAMIIAASQFVNKDFNGKIKIAGVVQEETDSKGTQYLLEKGIDADYIIIGEPSGVDAITFAYKGRIDCQISVMTEAGHTGACWQYTNAIETAFKLWDNIVNKIEHYEETSYFNSVVPCLTSIHGGQFENVVPNKCEMRFDIRFPPKYTSHSLFGEITSCINNFKTQNEDVEIDINLISASEAIETDKRSDLMKAFKKAIRTVLKKHPRLIRKTGSSDMNEIGAQMQIPIVAYGPGDSKLDHSANEFIAIEEFLRSIEVLKEVVLDILRIR